MPKILQQAMLVTLLAFALTGHTLADPLTNWNQTQAAPGSQGPARSLPWNQKNYPPRQFPAIMSGGPRPQVLSKPPEVRSFLNNEAAGTVIIVNRWCKLYYTLSPTQAYEYPISIGRLGFTWTGTEKISRMVDWPDWIPPAEMLQRQPELPRKMTGGIDNPLGARALYLGNTLYRIHGTNDARSIGYAASSGCFRMMNEHVMHLSSLVNIGTNVKVVENWPAMSVLSARPYAQLACQGEIPVGQSYQQSVTRERRGLGVLGVFKPWRWYSRAAENER